MARRARSAPKIGWLLAALAAALLLIAAGGYFLGTAGTPYRTAAEFPVEEYLTTSTSLRGNSYRLSGAVLNSITWSPDEGRLVSVQPTGSQSPIPLVIPADLGETNIQKGQRFHFLVEVRESGILYVTSLTKS
ncbi:MAG: hypothetical protein IAE97_07880 [Chthoniobacterales bacterium]|nr:hypothetical protein [Chthoniobacterales bacterium]